MSGTAGRAERAGVPARGARTGARHDEPERRTLVLAPPESAEPHGPRRGAGEAGGELRLPGGHGRFAESWWAAEWLRALAEAGPDVTDEGRRARGRAYAQSGRVGPITVSPGRLAAPVHGGRARPYEAEIRLGPLDDGAWDRLLTWLAAEPSRTAALLGRRLPAALWSVLTSAELPLLPAPGTAAPSCSCPDGARLCKHVAALWHRTAGFLDADPYVLLLLRGRAEDELVDELARRSALLGSRAAPSAPRREGDEPGVPAHEALATSIRPPLPEPFPAPASPGAAPTVPEPPASVLPGAAPELDAVAFLAANAAVRAYAVLTDPGHRDPVPPEPRLPPDERDERGGRDEGDARADTADVTGRKHAVSTEDAVSEHAASEDGPPEDPAFPEQLAYPRDESGADSGHAHGGSAVGRAVWLDAVRLAATHPGLTGRAAFSDRFARLARATGRTVPELQCAAAAWRQGGATGLSVLEAPWDPPAGNFDRARGALLAASLPRMTIRRNRLTDPSGARQLRYGPDGRWYPYRKGPSGPCDWWPEGSADADPVAVLRALLRDPGP